MKPISSDYKHQVGATQKGLTPLKTTPDPRPDCNSMGSDPIEDCAQGSTVWMHLAARIDVHSRLPLVGILMPIQVGPYPRAHAAARARSRLRSRVFRVREAARSNSARASSNRPSLERRSPRTLGKRW